MFWKLLSPKSTRFLATAELLGENISLGSHDVFIINFSCKIKLPPLTELSFIQK